MIYRIRTHLEKIDPLKFKPKEKVISIKKLSRGESNTNYLIKTDKSKYVIRFDILNKTCSEFKQEFLILKKIEKLNLGSKPLFLDVSKKYFKENFMILSYLNGISLDKLSKKKYNSNLNKIATLLGNLHNTKLDFKNKYFSFKKLVMENRINIKKIKKQVNKNGNLFQLCDTYSKHLKILIKDYKPKLKFCHGDVCLPNILINKGEFFLIDWESAGNLDPALELSLHFYEFNYSSSQKNSFLKKYLKLTKDKTLKERMEFTDFYMAFSGYFDVLVGCFNIVNKIGHKKYLESANFKEYWNWGNYYLGLIFKLELFDKTFEEKLKKELKEMYNKLKKYKKL